MGKELSGRKKSAYRCPEGRSCPACQRTAKRPVKQEKNKKEGGRTGREKVGSKGQGDGLWFLQNIVKTLLLFCRRSQRRLLSRGICSLSDVLQDHSGKSTDGRL